MIKDNFPILFTSLFLLFSLQSYAQFSLGQDTILCNGQSITLVAGIDVDTTNYLWQDNSISPNFVVTNSGLYSVTVTTDSSSVFYSDSILVQVNPTPQASFNTIDMCQGDSTIFNNTTIAEVNATYQWDFGDTSMSNLISPIHLYTGTFQSYPVELIVDNNNGCLDTSTSIVTVLLNPQANFTIDSVCNNELVMLNNMSTNLTNTFGGTVAFGEGSISNLDSLNLFQNYQYSNAGTYFISVIVENNNGCIDTFDLSTVIYPIPNVNFTGLAQEYCIGGMGDTLIGTPSGGLFSGVNVEDMSANDSLGFLIPTMPSDSTLVYYSFEDLNGCVGVDSQYLSIVYPQPDVEYFGLDSLYCQGDSMVLITGNLSGGIFSGTNVIQDMTGDTDVAIFDPIESGLIEILYTFYDSITGCQNSTVQMVEVAALPNVDLPTDTILISGQPLILGPENNLDVSYSWSNGANSNTIEINNPGYYILTATTIGTECIVVDTVLVNIVSDLNEIQKEKLVNVYPNPFNDLLNIEFLKPPFRNDNLIQVFDLTWKLVISELKEGSDVVLNLDKLEDGIYFVKIRNEIYKVIKQ